MDTHGTKPVSRLDRDVTWDGLFERAASVEVTEPAVREALTEHRERSATGGEGAMDGDGDGDGGDDPPETADPTRVVADADVLAADLLVGGSARRALDRVREHSWIALVASDPLVADTRAVIEGLTDEDALAVDWAERVHKERTTVEHPDGDHPALASAYRGGAAHLLSFDERLTAARAGLSVQPHLALSVREPGAFAAVFDAAALYESQVDGTYPGPDRDPRE